MKRLLERTVPPKIWLLVGAVPPKKVVIARNSPIKKWLSTVPTKKLKRLLVGTVPPKNEEVIGRKSSAKNKVIGRN